MTEDETVAQATGHLGEATVAEVEQVRRYRAYRPGEVIVVEVERIHTGRRRSQSEATARVGMAFLPDLHFPVLHSLVLHSPVLHFLVLHFLLQRHLNPVMNVSVS